LRQVGGEFIGLCDGPHLNRTQGHALAARLGTTDESSRRLPPTDTGSPREAPEEIYFPLSYERMGLCLYRLNLNVSASDVGLVTQLTTGHVKRAWAYIDAKRNAMRHMDEPSSLVGVMTDFGD
jgi:NAD+ synthase